MNIVAINRINSHVYATFKSYVPRFSTLSNLLILTYCEFFLRLKSVILPKFSHLYFMKSQVNIDFQRMGEALRQHVRQKAARSGSTIVYLKNSMLIEEDPKTHQQRILKQIDDKIN